MTVEFGTGPASLPYHRFGHGEEQLVVVPGVMDSLGWNTPQALTATLLARYYFRRFQEFDVWVLSRPPGLSDGVTAAGMARAYGEALNVLGSSHVLGFSLGGAVGTHLAASYEELVDSLILAGAGYQHGPYGRTVVARWEGFAADRQWERLHVDYSRIVYAGVRRLLVPPLYRVGARFMPTPEVEGDVTKSIAAARSYDGREVLADVKAPTLVVGGRDDVLYPPAVRRETAQRLENGHVSTLPGGHAVYEESRRAFGETVTPFLDGTF